jgi:molybdopterin-binding protein
MCGAILDFVPQYRLSEAARLLGVSDDTVRRFVDIGVLSTGHDATGRRILDGGELARFARSRATPVPDPTAVRRSTGNAFTGLITAVTSDGVMAQVEIQCGHNRVVALISSEAVRELRLEPGVLGVAVVKATDVSIQVPEEHPAARQASVEIGVEAAVQSQ